MKHILSIAVVAAAFALSAVAQVFTSQSLYSAGNATIAANTSTNLPATVGIITARKNANVGLQATFSMNASSTANVTFNFARSLDGSRFESTPSVSLVVPANGTNAVTAVTNVNLGALGALKLTSVQNSSTNTTVTNAAVNFSIKPDVK